MKLVGRDLKLSFGKKKTDLISAKEVRWNAEVDQLSPKLIAVHNKLAFMSKYFGRTEIFEKDLSESDTKVLKEKGFTVLCRTRTVKGRRVVKDNHYIVKAY